MSYALRAHLETLPPYQPVEPLEAFARRLGWPLEELVKLDANENPYGPLPLVRRALAEVELHRYPDPQSRRLRQALERFTGVSAERLVVGAGADELIDLLIRLTLEPGEAILTCQPTFGMYAFDALLNAGRVLNLPRRPDFSLDVEAIREAVYRYRPRLLFLATPNNPDGSLPEPAVLEALLELPLLVVLDEAYIEFSDDALGASRSRICQVAERENLVVLRTFSKWAGLAGLRVGYGAFPDWLLPTLWKAKQPYNVNVAAEIAACVSLEHLAELEVLVRTLIAERERLAEALRSFPFLEVYPSQANFLLCRVSGGPPMAQRLQRHLAAGHGILVRYFDKPGLQDCLRISVGRPQDTERLLRALEEFSPR